MDEGQRSREAAKVAKKGGFFAVLSGKNPVAIFAPEARMKVAGGKLGETKRTHRIG